MKLLALYLGGKADKANIEVHDVIFLATDNWEKEKEHIRSLWFGRPDKVHIDAIARIERVDGYDVKIQEESELETQLWFVNFGAVLPSTFSEYHENGFVVAPSKEKAIGLAKQRFCLDMKGRHCDALLEIESCISVSGILGNVSLSLSEKEGSDISIENCYIPV